MTGRSRRRRAPAAALLLGGLLALLPAGGTPASQESPAPAGIPAAAPAGTPAAQAEGAPALEPDALGDVPPDDPRMESYSHGNYVLRLLGFLWDAGVLSVIVFSGFAGTLQRWAGRFSRRPNLKVAACTVLFTLVMFAATFPLRVYGGFVREKQYGFSNQTFSAWLSDEGKGLLVESVLQVLLFVVLYAALRRLGRGWWLAGWGVAVAFVIFVLTITPVYIAPLFNTFKPLQDSRLRTEILELARSEGIPADEVYEVDASRQSSHNNAYVVGLLGTQRIVLYDTILKRLTHREIRFIMGHEMGHYVLHHIWKSVLSLSVLLFPGLYLMDRVSRRVIESRPRLGIADLAEPASIPLLSLVLAVFVFVSGPLINTYSRMQEHQADLFGLDATRDPEAAASAFLKFGKLDLDEYHVHPIIETLLYDHPALASRVRSAQEYARDHGATPPAD